MIVQNCMHIDATDAKKKWKMRKMMQFVMSQDKKTSITPLKAGLQQNKNCYAFAIQKKSISHKICNILKLVTEQLSLVVDLFRLWCTNQC